MEELGRELDSLILLYKINPHWHFLLPAIQHLALKINELHEQEQKLQHDRSHQDAATS